METLTDLCSRDPNSITMVSVALLAHRSSRGKMDSNSNRKNQRKHRENRWQIETKVKEKQLDLGSDRKVSNPNPRGKGTPDLLGLCVTHGRTCAGRTSDAPRRGGAPQQAAACRSGRRGHERAREGSGHRRQAARRRRALARAERVRRRGGRRRRRPRVSPAAMDARVTAASRGERREREKVI